MFLTFDIMFLTVSYVQTLHPTFWEGDIHSNIIGFRNHLYGLSPDHSHSFLCIRDLNKQQVIYESDQIFYF